MWTRCANRGCSSSPVAWRKRRRERPRPHRIAGMAIDVTPLWDYDRPALSEERFRAAIVRAAPDDELILQTQVARTWGIRKDFAKAREILASLEPRLAQASPEARVRWSLEM